MRSHSHTDNSLSVRFLQGVLAISVVVLIAHNKAAAQTREGKPLRPVTCRIGIVMYEGWGEENDRYLNTLHEIAEDNALNTQRETYVRFTYAIGTYEEVYHWFLTREIDAAIVTPAVCASLLQAIDNDFIHLLGTRAKGPTAYADANKERKEDKPHHYYHSVCIVPIDSPFKSIDDVRENRNVRFLMGSPLSTSGSVVPRAALRQIEFPLNESNISHLGDHSVVVQQLQKDDGKHHQVAFVCDYTKELVAAQASIRRLSFPILDAIRIPEDAFIAWRNDAGNELSSRFEARGDNYCDFLRTDTSLKDYVDLGSYLDEHSHNAGERESRLTIEEVIWQLKAYYNSHKGAGLPFRFAVVLSGGGAKCSYQTGVLEELERRLAEARRERDGSDKPLYSDLDIHLVVGTSGGAINAVPTAMKLTASEDGVTALESAWSRMTKRRLLRPHWTIVVVHGVWIAAIVVISVSTISTRRQWHWKVYGSAVLAVAALCAIGAILVGSFSLLDNIRSLVFAWYLPMGLWTSSIAIILLGILVLTSVEQRWLPSARVNWRAVLIGIVVLAPIVQVANICFVQETVFAEAQISEILAEELAEMIDLDVDESKDVRYQVGEAITDRIERDLLITGSIIDRSSGKVFPDVDTAFFYFDAGTKNKAQFMKANGISLHERGKQLTDIIGGSGSIYPFFPSQRVTGLQGGAEWIEIIDGGFAHNSPIHAAVAWGATHIFVINVSPLGELPRGGVIKNLVGSVSFLHEQAQVLDKRSSDRAVVYRIDPKDYEGRIQLLDFTPHVVETAIEDGKSDLREVPAGAEDVRIAKRLSLPPLVPARQRDEEDIVVGSF